MNAATKTKLSDLLKFAYRPRGCPNIWWAVKIRITMMWSMIATGTQMWGVDKGISVCLATIIVVLRSI
jgi:hypothetical protein